MYSILLVDDDVLALEGLKSGVHYHEIGFEQVYCATSMKSACEILSSCAIDVLVTDIEMPGGSGLELQKWLVEKGLKVVTVFLTCHASFQYAQNAIRQHIFDYLLKPIRYPEFEQKLLLALQECPRWKETAEMDAHLLADAQKKKDSDAPLVMQIKEYIDEHISEELTRVEIGKAFYRNPDYIARIFKNEEGVSLTNYVRVRRIRIAQNLLAETDRSIERICQDVGYSYNTYFFNTFKAVTGISPSKYRKNTVLHGNLG